MSFASHSRDHATHTDVSFPSTFENELKQLIRTRTGIVVQEHQLENLFAVVTTAMKRFGHLKSESYLDSLRIAEANSPELEFLVTGITVGESYFFRDTAQINFLREQYLPGLIAERDKTHKHLRIWSAGCSDGQELYTLAFILRELIPDLESWRLHLLGTDINTEALAASHSGHYREWSFRNTADSLRRRYFDKHENAYVLNEDIRHMARFTYLNLADDAFPSLLTDTNGIDLILCRNVFIYFDQATVNNVLQKFVQCLVPGGVLMVGASDLVDINVPGLELKQHLNTFYYQRPSLSAQVEAQPRESKPSPPLDKLQSTIIDRKKSTDSLVPGTADVLLQVREHLTQEQWQAADKAVDHCLLSMDVSSELLVYKATAAANLGNLDQASQLCEQALELDAVDKHAHFLFAIVQMELEQIDLAEAAFRKVLFLDAKFLEAHYQLGLLQLRCGRHVQGMKSLKNALQLAEQGDPQHNLHGAPDTSFQRMAEMLRNEITLHEKTLKE